MDIPVYMKPVFHIDIQRMDITYTTADDTQKIATIWTYLQNEWELKDQIIGFQ